MSVLLRQVASIGWHRILVIFLVLWLLVLLLSAFPGLNSTNTFDSRSSERLARALSDLEALRKQNEELQIIFKEISTKYVHIISHFHNQTVKFLVI